MDPFASEEISDIAILFLRGSNSVRVSARFRLQLKKCNYKLDKETDLTRLRIVLRDSVFVHLKNLNDLITSARLTYLRL